MYTMGSETVAITKQDRLETTMTMHFSSFTLPPCKTQQTQWPFPLVWLEPAATFHILESFSWNIQDCCLLYQIQFQILAILFRLFSFIVPIFLFWAYLMKVITNNASYALNLISNVFILKPVNSFKTLSFVMCNLIHNL